MTAPPRPAAPAGLAAAAGAPAAGAGVAPGHRERLVAGVVAAVAERGYAATTITDVVRHARVSRRTFYEHFPDKEACFLAAYDAVSDAVLAAVEDAATARDDAADRLAAGVRAYLAGLAAAPALARVFTVDVLGAGPRALARRRAVLRRFAATLRAQVDAAVGAGAPGRPIDEDTALALAGAIHELVLAALEAQRGDALPTLEGTIAGLIAAAVAVPR